MKKLTAIATAIALTLTLTACAKNSAPEVSPGDTDTTPAVVSTPALDKGDALLTINGEPVYRDELKFWAQQSLSMAGIDPAGEIDWEQTGADDTTLADFIKSEMVQSTKIFRAVKLNAAENGITLNDEEREHVDNLYNEFLGYFEGDETALDEYLASSGMTVEMMKYQEEISILYGKLSAELTGENGEKITDENALEWGDENGVLRAKHILFKTKGDDRVTPLSDELIALAKESADNAYAELSAITDVEQMLSTYDILMQDLSEDPGKMTNPDGYQFTPGTMREAFTATIQGLDMYGVSEPVDIEDGYSVMLRLPLDPDMAIMGAYEQAGTLRGAAAYTKMDLLIEVWSGELAVEYTDAYENLSIAELIK